MLPVGPRTSLPRGKAQGRHQLLDARLADAEAKQREAELVRVLTVLDDGQDMEGPKHQDHGAAVGPCSPPASRTPARQVLTDRGPHQGPGLVGARVSGALARR